MTPEELIALRKSKRLSQQALADMLEVTRLTVANWERGRYKMPDDILARVAGARQVERIEKPLKGDQYYRKVKNGVTRTLSHPFWYLGVNSPYRKMMEAQGKIWREMATTADLEGYTAPTEEQAYAQLLAAGCDPHASHWYMNYMGYYRVEKPPAVIAQDLSDYKRDWAEYQKTNPGGGWRDFDALYPQHREQRPHHEPTEEELEQSRAMQRALDDAFTFKT